MIHRKKNDLLHKDATYMYVWTNQPATTLRLARADPSGQRWGTTDAETEVLFAEASEVSKAVAFVVTSGAGWNIALRSLTTARNHVVLISVFPDR